MTDLTNMSPDQRREIAENWLAPLSKYFEEKDYPGVGSLMLQDGYWRDLLTFRWRFENYHGVREIETWLRSATHSNPVYNFRIEGDPAVWPAPGSADTELGVLMGLEVGHGETKVYT